MAKPKYKILALIFDNPLGTLRQYSGREAWALNELAKAGGDGITTAMYPGTRLSEYVSQLRKSGLEIETKDEPHGGLFSGRHGRYILKTRLQLFPMGEESNEAAA